MFPVGIGNENLPEVIARDEAYNLLHTAAVELVEDVVEEQQRRTPTCRTAQKSNCASFKASTYVLFCPWLPSRFMGYPPSFIIRSSLCVPWREKPMMRSLTRSRCMMSSRLPRWQCETYSSDTCSRLLLMV